MPDCTASSAWDVDNYWIAASGPDRKTLLFRYKGGHPVPEAMRLENIVTPRARLLDETTMLVAEGDVRHQGNMYKVSLQGGASTVLAGGRTIRGCKSIFSISSSLYYFTEPGSIVKIDKDEVEELSTNKNNQAEVYEGSERLPGYHVENVYLTRAYAEGKAIGVALP